MLLFFRHGFKEREEDLRVHSFENELSLERKLANWERIRATLAKKSLSLPEGLIDATVHAKNGAAEYVRKRGLVGWASAEQRCLRRRGAGPAQHRAVPPFPDARLGCGRLLKRCSCDPILRRYILQLVHSMLTGENMLVQQSDQ